MNKIQDIFAFCDRWCERCPKASLCEAFAARPEIRKPENLLADDKINQRFWKEQEDMLPETIEYILKTAREKEADLNDFPGISTRPKFDLFQRKTVNNMVLKAGRRYEDMVDDFLDNLADAGLLVMEEFQPGSVFKIVNDALTETEKQKANDWIDVIMRYQLQLYLKLSRAYYAEGREEEEGLKDSELSDSAGTAKVCLLLIHRSLVAWHGLQTFFFDRITEIDEILFLLIRMKNRLESDFPEALKFVRPGWDD